jgi:hypothetical protein
VSNLDRVVSAFTRTGNASRPGRAISTGFSRPAAFETMMPKDVIRHPHARFPGIRTLHVSEAAGGIEELCAEITELAPFCKFRDCTHAREPGCAVSASVSDGTLKPERLARWRVMVTQNRSNSPKPAKPGGGRRAAARRRHQTAD